jgi:ribosomal protein S18 acetylase RimI-like enzyme
MMRRILNRLRPRTQTHQFFRCDLSGTDKRQLASGLGTIEWISSNGDPAFAALRSFAASQGFGNDWPADMLADHAQCALAFDEFSTPMAMAWMTRQSFYVEEMGATFDPRGAAYLFGDWVAPEFRGRRLQRLLVAYRLDRAVELQAREAYTIIHPENAASLKSYRQEGFIEEGEIESRTWLGRTRVSYISITSSPRLSYQNLTVRVI